VDVLGVLGRRGVEEDDASEGKGADWRRVFGMFTRGYLEFTSTSIVF
jgi:hypothetical protein